MDLFHNLALGFATAFTGTNLFYAFTGCLLGTLIGVLPGLGPLATIAMLLPMTYALTPEAALIMLAGIYYGAQYGGSTTAIVVNLPGESSSVVTTLDGYQMALRGRAGVALSTAAIASFVAGCFATLVVAALAQPLVEVALSFGPAEYFSMMVVGLILATVLSSAPFIEGVGMVLLGILLALIGTDVNSGVQRMTFGVPELLEGIDFVPLAMGVFGLAEIVKNLENTNKPSGVITRIRNMLPTREDIRRMTPPILRGTVIGSILGILPGGGSVMSSFLSYTVEKGISKNPQEFGHGAIEGVAGPEAANNAGAQTSFIPLLTLGVPSNAVLALMMGAMMIHNVQPGPQVITNNPTLYWGLIVSMWVGNLMLIVLNLPLVGIWVRLLSIPYKFLYPAIMVFCCIGVYSLKNGNFDVYQTAIFCVVGYFLIKLELPIAPMLIGLVLGPMLEENLRRAMLMSRGDPAVFFTSPISAGMLAVAAISIILITLPKVRSLRQEALRE